MPKQNPSATNAGGGAPIIRVNSNPNPMPAPGVRNPTQSIINRQEMNEPVYEKYGYPQGETIKIRTSAPLSQNGKLGGQHAGGHAGH
jgi:hypothetical protein